MTKAIFAGSFDPPTYGHLDIIERAKDIFDNLDIIIAQNKIKSYLFDKETRLYFMKNLVSQWDNVSVHICDKLIVDYAHETGATVLIRGIRNAVDFSYEFELALMNKTISSDIETLFIPTQTRFVVLRSSAIKELAQFGGDISAMVPPIVEKALKEIYHT